MSETGANRNSHNATDMPVGEILRRTRMHYKQGITDIERALRIRASQIEAIESGDLSALPGRVYALGFVRTYSEFLGLDGDKMVELYKQQSVGEETVRELNFPEVPEDSRMPSGWIVAASVLAVVLLLVFWIGGAASDRSAVNQVPPVPVPEGPPRPSPSEQAAAQSAQPAQSAAAVAPSQMPVSEGQETTAADAVAPAVSAEETLSEKPKKGIILNIRENSWVEIKDQAGKSLLSRVLQAGDEYFVPDRPDLAISIGNAGGVEIEVDGSKLRPLGKTGEVRRSLPLDAEYLKKNFADAQ